MAEDKGKAVHTGSKNKIESIYSTMNYAFKFEQIVGIHRFTYKDGAFLPPNWMNKAYALTLIVIFVGLFSAIMDLPNVAKNRTKNLMEVIDQLPSIVILSQYIITLIGTNFLFHKPNMNLLSMLAELDAQLLTDEAFYKRCRTGTKRFIAVSVISYVVISATDIITEDVIDVSVIMFLPLYLIQNLEIIMFCLSIAALKTRLEIINGYIAKFISEKDRDKVYIFTVSESKGVAMENFNMIGRPSESNMKIRDLATMYDKIGRICSLSNAIFNMQIFMTLLSTFIFIIITIWTSINVYRTPEDNSGPLITIIIRCFATLVIVAMMCLVCERLRLTRNSTKILINHVIMDYSLPKIMRVQAKAFMEQVEAWPLQILIYDMIYVDITLMLKFISVSTTYLIVIIQITHYT